VYFSLDVIDRMEREALEAFKAITRKGSEIGGILLGRTAQAGKRIITIEEYESIECDYSRGPLYILADADRKRIEQAIGRLKGNGTAAGIVGFFRSNTRRDIALDDDDLAVMKDYFADPANLCMLVKPFAMKPSTAAFFFWENGQIKGDECRSPFAFKRSELEKQFANLIVQPDDPSLDILAKPALSAAPAENTAPPVSPVVKPSAAPVPPTPKPVTAAPQKREEKPPVQPLPFKRDERPAIAPQPKVDARPAGPVLVKKEEPAAPSKPEEKPAIQPVAKREEKPAPATPVRNAAPVPPVPVKEKETVAVKAEPAPAPKADLPKTQLPKQELYSPLTAAVEPEKPGILSNKWIWIGLIVVLLGGGAAYKFMFTGNAAQQTTQADALSLRVERNAGQLLLTWNRNASAIQTASRATLTINDGDHREDADLDLGLLRSGNVVYTPITNDVSFRLEVTDVQGGKSVSESMRVLAGRPSPAPVDPQTTAAAQPAAQTPQKLTAVPAPEATPQAKPVEQASHTPAPVAQPPKAEVTATPVVTAEPPKPESLAARLSAPPSISEPPSLQGANALGGGVAIPSAITAAAPPPTAPAQSAPQQAARQAASAAPDSTQAAPKVGGMVQDARLIKREMPVYPGLARNARVSGTVRVEATIGPDGKVRSARALQGPPLLRQAAADAVKKWLYQPAMLNGQPTESTTQIDLLFAPSAR
jgi:protein TonB